SVNVGLVTWSSSAAPSPLTIPFVSVVFPAPRSPERRIKTGGFSSPPISRPTRIVSSEEWVTISLLATAQLIEKVLIGIWDSPNQIRSHQRRLPHIRGSQIASQTVE